MGIKSTLDNTTDMITYFGNSAWDVLRLVYLNIDDLTFLATNLNLVGSVNAQSSVTLKNPVNVATTTLTALNGLYVLDGVTLTLGMRVLVKNQTNPADNGIYDTNASTWTRTEDWDGVSGITDVVEGTRIPVNPGGTANGDTVWKVTNTGTITIGTTGVTIVDDTLVHIAGTETITGAKTFTGAFTSPGINDDASAEVVLITNAAFRVTTEGDNVLTWGANKLILGGPGQIAILHSTNSDKITYGGGSATNVGAAIQMDGAVATGDMRFYSSGNMWGEFKEVLGRFTIKTGQGAKSDALVIDKFGKSSFSASTTDGASINLAEGVAPTSPIDGDVWVTAAGAINVRLNGVTVDLSAGGGGSALEVEDDGSSLSTAVSKFNFVGFNVTEPVANEIEITYGAVIAGAEYCPGYTSYTRVTDSQFTVDLADCINLFYIGRRVKFSKAGAFTYGIVASRDFNSTNANDTTVNMTMEGADTIPTATFDVCFVASSTAWSPIATDPFAGSSINDICTGIIGSTQWWFAVGSGGKVATSSDGGATWTIRTTTTSENLNVCTYDTINETFWGGGNAGVLVSTTNGTTITEDTTKIPALATTGNSNINGLTYSKLENVVMLTYEYSTATHRPAYTTNQGGNWYNATLLGATNGKKILACLHIASGTDNQYLTILNTNQSVWRLGGYTDTTYDQVDTSVGTYPTATGFFYDGSASCRLYGLSSGDITGRLTWTASDVTTFSNQLNDMAYSASHDRVVVVGNNGTLGYNDGSNKVVANSFTSVANGLVPTADFNAVAWNPTDAVFVAVASNGQILRSSNGIS